MEITFINVERINLDQDGLCLVYFYLVKNELHKYSTCTSCKKAMGKNFNFENRAKQVFTNVVNHFKYVWKNYQILPKEDFTFTEEQLLHIWGEETDWNNYKLILE